MKLPKRNRWIAPIIIIIGLIAAATFVTAEEDRLPAGVVKQPIAVDVIKAQYGTKRLDIPAWGFIKPCEQVDVFSQVDGLILATPPELMAGSFVTKGDVLFKIDPSDYINALNEAKAVYKQSLQALEIEKGKQKVAQAEFQLLKQSFHDLEQGNGLILREPQLKELEASLEIAATKVDQAKLNLNRTTVVSPCSGQILEEDISIGKHARGEQKVLTIACTDSYHITASFSPIYEPGLNMGDLVEVKVGGEKYEGVVKTIYPQINPNTRHKQVMVEIKGVRITLGAYAEINLKGHEFKRVIALPKNVLRANDTLWILSPLNTLDVRPITIAAQNDAYILVKEGLVANEKIILSHLAMPLKGMTLRPSYKVTNSEVTGSKRRKGI